MLKKVNMYQLLKQFVRNDYIQVNIWDAKVAILVHMYLYILLALINCIYNFASRSFRS